MNEVLKAIRERRSIRKFRSEMPERKAIDTILEARLYAPSGMNRQPVVTIAFTDKEQRDRLAELNRQIGGWPEGFDPFYGAPLVIAVLADRSSPTYICDGSLVMQNLMLAAHSLGLGSIWIHRAKEEFATPEYQELISSLGLTGDWEGIGHCAIGYYDGELPRAAERKPNRIFYI